MNAVTYVVRTKLRSLVVPALVLTAVVGIVLGIVITLAAGAHRTETLPQRVDAAAGGAFDYIITQQQKGQRPLTDQVGAPPGVESAPPYSFVFGGVAPAGTKGGITHRGDGLLFSRRAAAVRGHNLRRRAP